MQAGERIHPPVSRPSVRVQAPWPELPKHSADPLQWHLRRHQKSPLSRSGLLLQTSYSQDSSKHVQKHVFSTTRKTTSPQPLLFFFFFLFFFNSFEPPSPGLSFSYVPGAPSRSQKVYCIHEHFEKDSKHGRLSRRHGFCQLGHTVAEQKGCCTRRRLLSRVRQRL